MNFINEEDEFQTKYDRCSKDLDEYKYYWRYLTTHERKKEFIDDCDICKQRREEYREKIEENMWNMQDHFVLYEQNLRSKEKFLDLSEKLLAEKKKIYDEYPDIDDVCTHPPEIKDEFQMKFKKYSEDMEIYENFDKTLKSTSRKLYFMGDCDICKQRREDFRKKIWQNTTNMHLELRAYEIGVSTKEQFLRAVERVLAAREEIFKKRTPSTMMTVVIRGNLKTKNDNSNTIITSKTMYSKVFPDKLTCYTDFFLNLWK